MSLPLKRIKLSVFKYFNDNKAPDSDIYFEPMEDRPASSNYVEVRFNGPKERQIRKLTIYQFEINLLITGKQNSKDIDPTADDTQHYYNIMARKIDVFDSDGVTLLGCLLRDSFFSGDAPRQVQELGQIAPDNPMVQAIVEGHYRYEAK